MEVSIYEIPLILSEAGLDEIILKQFCIDQPAKPLEQWSNLIDSIKALEGEVVIGMVGKYAELQDAYKSVDEALIHAGYAVGKKIRVQKIVAEEIETSPDILDAVDGILIPWWLWVERHGG